MLSVKKITQNFFGKKILIFNAALLHLKFYYISAVVYTIVNLGQLILEANAPTSSWNFLMIFTFLESLYIVHSGMNVTIYFIGLPPQATYEARMEDR